ncbi:MAG: hypothetical protein O3C51_16240 [Planctomycetota bacterium]|nr:hypothetical protein [Planctomycetota bacterium]
MIRVLAAVLMALCAGGAARSQTQQVGLPVPGVQGESITAVVRSVSASARPGGHGFVLLELHNPTDRLRKVSVDLRESWSPTYSAAQDVTLDPDGRVRLELPVRHIGYQASPRARVDGGRWYQIGGASASGPEGFGVSIAVVTAPGLDVPGLRAVLERLTNSAPNPGIAFHDPLSISIFEELRPRDLPRTWDGLSGFDLVIADARRGGIDVPSQSLLRDYVRAGGHLLLVGTDALDGGPLADVFSGLPLAVGFGRALGLSSAEAAGFPGNPGVVTRLSPWLTSADGALARGARPVSGPLPPEIYQQLVIPSVGDVPYRAYLAVLLLFGVLVGPVNYMVLRRRRQLGYMLLTVPALGLLTTTILLAYGLLQDGLDLHSASRSLTLLDQVRHEAVSWEGRTVFAGLPPSKLRPRATTCFDITAILQSEANDQGIMLEFKDGVVGGSAIPARTSVTFGVATVGTERARLRFERLEDGALGVLAGDGLLPLEGPHHLVMRTAADAYWLQAADGRLLRVEPAEAVDVVRHQLRRFDDGVVSLASPRALFPLGDHFGEGGAAEGMRVAAGPDGLPIGCYLAVVARPAALDDLGLGGEEIGYHLVLGRIGPEDIVD